MAVNVLRGYYCGRPYIVKCKKHSFWRGSCGGHRPSSLNVNYFPSWNLPELGAKKCSCRGAFIVASWHVSSFKYNKILLQGPLPQKGKGLPQQAEVRQGVPDTLRPRIFLTFGTTRVVGCQPYAPAAFTPEEIPGTHFQRLSRPQGTWFYR